MGEKNCIVIHGCPDEEEVGDAKTYDKHWMPWIKQQLIQRGVPTQTPQMPRPWQPNYEAFKQEFEKYPVTAETILIAHSCGSAFLVRWLGETKKSVAKVILVAPWKIPPEDDEGRKAFYLYPIDESIKTRVKDIVIFTSDNEEEDGKNSAQLFHQALGGQLIELPGKGHYTQDDMGTGEFPELLDATLR